LFNENYTIGDNCLIGLNAHLVGFTVENNVFIATGASVFHGATLKSGSEVSINCIVHLKPSSSGEVPLPNNGALVSERCG